MNQPSKASLPPIREFVFRPLMDWWFALMLLPLTALLVASIPIVIWRGGSWHMAALAVLVIIGIATYIIDKFFFQNYILTEDGLWIRSNFAKFYVPYRDMAYIRQGGVRGLISGFSLRRFAFSRKSLIIELKNGPYKAISVSPQDKDAFLAVLLESIEIERGDRSTVIKEKKKPRSRKRAQARPKSRGHKTGL